MTIFMIALAAGVVVAILIIASLGPVQSGGWYDDDYGSGTVFDFSDWGSSDSGDGGCGD